MASNQRLKSLILLETTKEVRNLYERGEIDQEQLNELLAGLKGMASGLMGAAGKAIGNASATVQNKVSGAYGQAKDAATKAYQNSEAKAKLAAQQKINKTISDTIVAGFTNAAKLASSQAAKLGPQYKQIADFLNKPHNLINQQVMPVLDQMTRQQPPQQNVQQQNQSNQTMVSSPPQGMTGPSGTLVNESIQRSIKTAVLESLNSIKKSHK